MTWQNLIKSDEGCRLIPYEDTLGNVTIGYGRNLGRGIRRDEAELMFQNDLYDAETEVLGQIGGERGSEDPRYGVLVNMCFNMGIIRLLGFTEMLSAYKAGNYDRAALEMLASRWAKQVPRRAVRLAGIMRSGKMPD